MPKSTKIGITTKIVMDKFIVRLSILALNIYIFVVLLFAFNGIDISVYDYIFTDSILFGVVLTTLVHAQGRYHCKWIRFMCYDLIVIPSINFVDTKYYIFVNAEDCIYLYCSIVTISVLITLFLAIRHFIKVQNLKSNKRRLYEDRRRNERED